MSQWCDELHAVFLQLNGYMNRPDLDAAFLALADVKLDRALYPLLLRIGYAEPIGVVDLAGLVGRNHSTVSRQVAKLEALGLVERHVAMDDQRIRLLKPSAAGRKMLATFSDVRRRFLDQQLGDWTDEDRKLLLDLLQRLSAKIGEVSMIWTAAAGHSSHHGSPPVTPEENRDEVEGLAAPRPVMVSAPKSRAGRPRH